MDTRVRRDGQPIFFVDESGCKDIGRQGDYYVFAGLLTTNPDGIEKLARSIKNRHYPQRDELKSASMKPDIRSTLLAGLAAIPDTKVAIHVVAKNEIRNPSMLGDEQKFYKRFFTNLLKTALDGHTHGIHVVTDQHHGTQAAFEHFENCLRYVNGGRVLSVNPVCSTTEPCIWAADTLAGTLRKRLHGHPHGVHWDLVKPIRIPHWNNVFPYQSRIANLL